MKAHHLVAASLILLFALLLSGCTVRYVDPPREVVYEEPPPPPPPEAEFYQLNDYGDWVDVYPFGSVWRPHVAHGWQPYNHGHWVWSEWGWTWVSYEPVGWIVYHYGNWKYDSVWGWIWIPGHDWEPVRVQWMWYGDYVCWAPMPPSGYLLPDPWQTHTNNVWIVVHNRHFTNYDLHRFHVRPSQYGYKYKPGIRVYREPPQVRVIEKHTRRPVHAVTLNTKSYKAGKYTYKKIVLPAEEKKIVRKYKRDSGDYTSGTTGEKSKSYKEKYKRTTPQQQKAQVVKESPESKSKTKSKSTKAGSSRSTTREDEKNSQDKSRTKKKKGEKG